jgi:hypothetical protein
MAVQSAPFRNEPDEQQADEVPVLRQMVRRDMQEQSEGPSEAVESDGMDSAAPGRAYTTDMGASGSEGGEEPDTEDNRGHHLRAPSHLGIPQDGPEVVRVARAQARWDGVGGRVRTVKFGDKQGSRLFRLEDIDETLKKLAQGVSPRRPSRGGRRTQS